MGSQEKLLKKCFWREDLFKEYGVFVCRFFKDCNLIFVVIDDRIPVKARDGRVIFAQCKDPNELWVPLIEKAYAKLHGCYKALIGGYSHFALGDMTGFPPHSLVLKPGFVGFTQQQEPDDVWLLLKKYRQWNCLLGCSIQPDPKAAHKAEEAAGGGLHSGHAYSLLDIGEINIGSAQQPKLQRLLKLRNPWGRGEWEGSYGDRSEEREKYDSEIKRVFQDPTKEQEFIEVNFNDGTFFMTFEEWIARFTSLFVAINFPSHWTGKRATGVWTGGVGGNRSMGTWVSNPKLRFRLDGQPGTKKEVFVGLYINDSRLTMGFDYFKDPLYANPLAFDIVTEADFNKSVKDREMIPGSIRPGKDTSANNTATAKELTTAKQPAYNYGNTQIEVMLEVYFCQFFCFDGIVY